MTSEPSSRIKAFIEYHRATPRLSYETYMRRKVLALGRSVEHASKIYLDVNFWLMLRDADRGARAKPGSVELLAALRSLVARGIAFCPISESTYFEVLKQDDEATRVATAKLMDELSKGIALAAMDMRIASELLYALHVFQGKSEESLDPLDALVWTRAGHVIGMDPNVELGFDLPVAERTVIMKAMFDEMWSLAAHELIEYSVARNLPAPRDFDALASYMNAGNALHAETLRSFQQAYNAELQGSIDFCAKLEPERMQGIAAALTEPTAELATVTLDRASPWRAALVRRLRADEVKRILATLHIHACLHASVRWDKRRQVESNDIFDFNHASDALPYCDAFFTERPLHTMLSANHIVLDKLYECRVCSDMTDAIAYVKALR